MTIEELKEVLYRETNDLLGNLLIKLSGVDVTSLIAYERICFDAMTAYVSNNYTRMVNALNHVRSVAHFDPNL